MTNKYRTGSYMIVFYDVHGTKQETVSAESFSAAEAVGDKGISAPPYASYVITRVIKNTLDNAYPWTTPS
jgi:hypothetical protein